MNKTINDLCFVIAGGTPKTSNPAYWNGNIPWLSIKDFITTNRYVSNAEKTITKLGLSNSATNILQVNDIIISARGTVGKLAIISKPMAFNQSCYGIRTKDSKKLNQIYLYYWLLSHTQDIQIGTHGAVFDTITRNDFDRLIINIPTIQNQLHIVNTIGSVDDLIENYMTQNEKIFDLGIIKINDINISNSLFPMTNIGNFIKGTEVGSANYHESKSSDMIQFIRVGDLTTTNNIYVMKNDELKISKFNDILIAFDGAPGRNNVGIEGAYSSGICSIESNLENKGLMFFEINSQLNQQIIRDYTQGTTILHASKSIPYLQCADISINEKAYLNKLFELFLQNKKKIEYLKEIKSNLLNKYF